MVRPFQPLEVFRMRKLIIATAAVALLSASGAFAQSTDKAAAPDTSATSGDSMSKGDGMKMSKTKKSKKAKKTSGDEAK
jgi:Spy/CpxP family protein refolding chaperone